MKPKTWKEIKDKVLENTENINWSNDNAEVHDMIIENEIMEWISISEGKGKDFTKWSHACQISVEDREQNG